MNFVFLISKEHWFFKLGRLQFGNPGAILGSKFGFSRMTVGNQLMSHWVWKGTTKILSTAPTYKNVYELDKPDEIVVRNCTRDGTGEKLKYQSGYLLVYKDGVLESRSPYWIDVRNDTKVDSVYAKHTNVPFTNKRGELTDINKYLNLMQGMLREMESVLK